MSHASLSIIILTESGKVIIGGSRDSDINRLWECSNFKDVPQFLESSRISLPYCLTRNIEQTFTIKTAFILLISRNVLIMCNFKALRGHDRV